MPNTGARRDLERAEQSSAAADGRPVRIEGD